MPKIHLKVREKIFEYEAGLTLETISRDFQKAYPHDIILARVDGKLAELMKTIDEDVSVEFITTGEIIWISSAILLKYLIALRIQAALAVIRPDFLPVTMV